MIEETDSDGQPCRYLNHYQCSRCSTTWSDRWSCACNDRCPTCNAEIEPYDSDVDELDSLHFVGSDFVLTSAELDESLRSALLDCGRPGDASEAVAYVRRHFDVSGDEVACAAMLRGYGAWDDAELADHGANLDRLVWLTGCALAETGEAYFAAY